MTRSIDRNASIIGEFRANAGVVGGSFAGVLLLLLTSTGARTGRLHTTPLVYLPDGDQFVVCASNAGAPAHPDWYHNLLAHPRASIEVGGETIAVVARLTAGRERDQLYAAQVRQQPRFEEYQSKTDRQVPVFKLSRQRP